MKERQKTRGHNIVADGWAEASNPQPRNAAPFTPTHTQDASKTLVFSLSDSCTPTGRRTDGWTDGRTKPHIELYKKKTDTERMGLKNS